MTETRVDERKILDYLLGILPEPETEHLDEMSFTDDEFVRQLMDVENDLVDTYVRGDLSGDMLAKFRSHYLVSPRRLEKVAFAETFRGLLQNKPIVAQEVGKSLRTTTTQTRLFGFFPIQWGVAALALLVIGLGGYLLVENLGLRNQISQAREEQQELQHREQELQSEIAQERASASNAGTELVRVQQRLAQLEQQLAGNGSPQPEKASGDVKLIAFNLLPQTRGFSRLPLLTVPAETDFVALNLEMDVKDFPFYQAALKDSRTGKIMWRSSKLKYDGESSSMILGLPADIVKEQNYILELSGISAEGKPEIVSTYSFRVIH